MDRRLLTAVSLTAAAALLAACSGGSPTDPAETTPPATSETFEPVDRAADLAPWSDIITSATETEPGRVEILTSLEDTSDPAAALELCDAAASLDGVEYVSVAEADGTTWIVYGHPAYPADVCSVI